MNVQKSFTICDHCGREVQSENATTWAYVSNGAGIANDYCRKPECLEAARQQADECRAMLFNCAAKTTAIVIEKR